MRIILWLNDHRLLTVFAVSFMLWGGSYGYYFRHIIRNWFVRGKAHNWSVDMVSKKAVSHGREQV
jgi:hypothetical protein